MVLHQAPTVYVNERPAVALDIWVYETHNFEAIPTIRIRKGDVVELIQIMHKAKSILIVHKEISTVYTSVKGVPKLHNLIITNYGFTRPITHKGARFEALH
jgi:hypothetical protein